MLVDLKASFRLNCTMVWMDFEVTRKFLVVSFLLAFSASFLICFACCWFIWNDSTEGVDFRSHFYRTSLHSDASWSNREQACSYGVEGIKSNSVFGLDKENHNSYFFYRRKVFQILDCEFCGEFFYISSTINRWMNKWFFFTIEYHSWKTFRLLNFNVASNCWYYNILAAFTDTKPL